MANSKIVELLGDKAESLLTHSCNTISKDQLHLPGPNHVEQWMDSNRNNQTLRSMHTILNHGRLAGTGYVSILPVDQGVEHNRRAAHMGDLLGANQGENLRRVNTAQEHVHASQGSDGPGVAPAVAMEHR